MTFLVNGKVVLVDSKAPFTLRFKAAGHPARLKVTARVRAAGKTTLVSKTVKPC